jgi:hypothetical protein
VSRITYCCAECHYAGCRNAECHYAQYHYTLSDIQHKNKQNVKLSVVILSVIYVVTFMMSVSLSLFMSVVMLNVVAPRRLNSDLRSSKQKLSDLMTIALPLAFSVYSYLSCFS